MLLLERDAPPGVRDALSADDAGDHGQGRRGHRVLPLRPAARAQRRRRRPVAGSAIDVGAFHAGNVERARALPAEPADDADPRRQALGRRPRADRRAGLDARRVARRTSGAGSSSPSAAARRGGAPDDVERYFLFQTLVGAWPIERRPDRGVHGEGAARGQAQHRLGRAERRLGGGGQALRAARCYADAGVPAPTSSRSSRGSRRVGERASLGQLVLKLTAPGRPRHLPGRRARVPRARRPRQPPAGRLGLAPGDARAG